MRISCVMLVKGPRQDTDDYPDDRVANAIELRFIDDGIIGDEDVFA